jgi:hypothetical protein
MLAFYSVTESAACSRPSPRGETMCEKCEQLDVKIQRYRKFATQGLDPLTTERINALILELERRKEAVH